MNSPTERTAETVAEEMAAELLRLSRLAHSRRCQGFTEGLMIEECALGERLLREGFEDYGEEFFTCAYLNLARIGLVDEDGIVAWWRELEQAGFHTGVRLILH
jgi:hypothetical protein